MANFTRNGYGQVEPNQLSAQRTGEVYASLPLDTTVDVLQNGEFMYYDQAKGMVTATPTAGSAEPMLVFNEVKIYADWLSYKDFAMIKAGDNYVTNNPLLPYGGGADTTGVAANPAHVEYGYRMDGFAPRLIKVKVGDVFTTNMVPTGVAYAVGDKLTPKKTGNTLVLTKDTAATTNVYVVAKVYTMPDGQPGLKVQRIA